MANGRQWYFKLQQDERRIKDLFFNIVQIVNSQAGIRTRRDDNAILSVSVNSDQCYARWNNGIYKNKFGIDFFAAQRSDRLLPENIRPHFSNKTDVATQPGCSNRLVCALAPGIHKEITTQNRFAWSGNPAGFDNHIGI